MRLLLILLIGTLVCGGCKPEARVSTSPDPDPASGWLIPQEEVLEGGVGKDGIIALDSPFFVPAPAVGYMGEEELVLGLMGDNGPRAYPQKVFDWHEIVNEDLDGTPVALLYCPLTGTATAWSREIEGRITTFGISGLLFNSNMIPYDRLTDSHWSQLRNQCVEGEWRYKRPELIPLVETTWKEWRSMYPESQLMSLETGHPINYNFFPYFDYRENHQKLPFPISVDDDRLPRKTRVLGVATSFGGPKPKAKVYPLERFGDSVRVFQEDIGGVPVVVAGSSQRNFAVAFEARVNGERRSFQPIQNGGSLILEDAAGNQWDIFGQAIAGPDQGAQLPQVFSCTGYWFAFGTFFPGLEIQQ